MTINMSLAQTDFYKTFHNAAYHPEITKVYSNFTSRNNRLSNVPDKDGVVFVGLQYFIKDFLIKEFNETFFELPKNQAIKAFKRIVDSALGMDYNMSHFEMLHDLGYLPIEIKALPEGVLVPYGVPPISFVNTVGGFQWLSNYIETVFSTENWPIQTTATTARAYLKNTTKSFKDSGLDEGMIPFMCHDFSFRGMFGRHAAAMSGFAHLTSFAGTDTIPAILFAEKYYNANVDKELVGASVSATEHSTATSYILSMVEEKGITKLEAEVEYVKYLMNMVPEGILSHVSDSFDFWEFVTKGLELLKGDIINRDGTLVIRPDSGDPVEVLVGLSSSAIKIHNDKDFDTWKCFVQEDLHVKFDNELDSNPTEPFGDWTETYEYCGKFFEVTYEPDLDRHDKTYYYISNWGDFNEKFSWEEIEQTPEHKGLVECLWDIFGGTINEKGYKVLNPKIGAIYGDSITLGRQEQIIKGLMDKGFAPNIVLGVGSYSYQYVTRDTHSSAVKTTWVEKNGKSVEVFKDPKTDSKKKSAKGLLKVELENGSYALYDQQTPEQEQQGELKTVFKDGQLLVETSLEEIRQRVKESL